MTEIYLDEVKPIDGKEKKTDPTGKTTIDHGAILQRLFNNRAYEIVRPDSSGQLQTFSGTAKKDDVIYLRVGYRYFFNTAVVQNSGSPGFGGSKRPDDDDYPSYETTDIEFDIANQNTAALELCQVVTLRRITLIDGAADPKDYPLLKLTGKSVAGSRLSLNCGSDVKMTTPSIVCEQKNIVLENCSFTGERTAFEARDSCESVEYINNLNHGDPRAVKINSPRCKIIFMYNTIDIGSQLLWMDGDVLPGSMITNNALQNHRPKMDTLHDSGHFIYIKGGINGLVISGNSFSGADGIDGDTSGKVQKDPEPDSNRPETHITLEAPPGKKITGLAIEQNQFRFAAVRAIEIRGELMDSQIRMNNFSGIGLGNADCAVLLKGDLPISGFRCSHNIASLEAGKCLINLSNRVITSSTIRANLVGQSGDVYVGLHPNALLDQTNIIKRNFDADN
jgi:hypothetical protein